MSSGPEFLHEELDRNRLLENMAQEIRTPLNAILGMIELLIDSPLTPEQQEYASLIQNSGDALLVLVNDLLDYTHLGSGELELTETAVDLRSCMDDALDMLASHAGGRSPNIACFIEPGVPEVIRADPIRLRQVLSRLIGYAVRLAEGSEIVASVKARPQGMEQYEIQFVIKKYGSSAAPHRTVYPVKEQQAAESLRLGLEICRLLIGKMGGRLTTAGSQTGDLLFSFSIQAEAELWQPVRRRQRSTQPLMGGKNVLLVVADEQQRSSLAQQLSYWQLRSVEAESAAQALEILASGEALDAAILWELPDKLNVSELARRIRHSDAGRSLPLILVMPWQVEGDEPPVGLSVQIGSPVVPYQLYEALTRMLAEQMRAQPVPATGTLLDAGVALRHPLNILLADPEEGERKITLRFLERLGYHPEQAESPNEMLQALLRQSFDVLIVDQELLSIDLVLLQKIEQLLPPIARPAVLVLGAQHASFDKKAVYAGEVQDYLFKPVRAGDLVQALEACRPLILSLPGKATSSLHDTTALAPIAITEELVKAEVTPAIDPSFLRQLSSMAGEDIGALLVQLVDIFTANAARLLVRMQQAVDGQDAGALQQAAAELRTSSENLGAKGLAELCARLGVSAGSGGTPEDQEQLRLILAEYNRARAALEQLKEQINR